MSQQNVRRLRVAGVEATTLAGVVTAFNDWIEANGAARTLHDVQYSFNLTSTNTEVHKIVLFYME